MPRTALALTALLVATTTATAPPATASDTDVCAGSGTMRTSTGIYAGIVKTNVGFTITMQGFCSSGRTSITLSGVFYTAWCGSSIGDGSGGGHSYNVTQVGPLLVFDGGVNGVLYVAPQPPSSCVAQLGGNGASQFLVSGALAFL